MGSRFSYASAGNATYIDTLYAEYQKSPEAVESSWRHFFEGYEFAQSNLSTSGSGDGDEAKVEAFINAFRRLGHLGAHLNPLEKKPQSLHSDLTPERHGVAQVPQDKVFSTVNLFGIETPSSFSAIFEHLQKTYCRSIGADFRDIDNIDAVVWLQEQMEGCANSPTFTKEEKINALEKLTQAEGFERFLQDRFLGQKRFSVEGLDTMIPLLSMMAEKASELGADEINLGMAHRGRLNVLANFMAKPHPDILSEFEGGEYNAHAIEGDVKYHKGYSSEIKTAAGKNMRLFLCPNPSHLEAVNPVLEGFTRARQRLYANGDATKIVPILIHGDAAFMGQGLVAETLNFADIADYTTGGTIHIIANNQLGFTANPEETKSGRYASDMSKIIRSPIFHVNADDPYAVLWTAKLAVMYRQKFAKDVVIDLIGYRRYGHNETDEPGFTQPLMYKTIKAHPSVLAIYAERLAAEGVLTKEEIQAKQKSFREYMQQSLDNVRSGNHKANYVVPEAFQETLRYVLAERKDIERVVATQIDTSTIKEITESICSFPTSFTPHPKIAKLAGDRLKMLEGEGSIDWGLAELLAYGSCAIEGIHVRLSGQDCRRGTFSHRHAVLRNFETNAVYEPLNQIRPGKQSLVSVVNSPLSEQGCLGFEFGYSVADSKALVLWEAQFGDFANGAQIIIDQFIAASEAKWKQTSSLVMLLPHGHEGQGPEHSSARPERFLQVCGNLNIQVANCTTASQLFHILRRQVKEIFKSR
jgi:2-oxoglutarate dehydrogenase E1 component